MAYTYEQLSKLTVADLRKIAEGIEHDAVHGYSTMHKEKLLPSICTALGIDTHVHHQVVGVNKTEVKAKIKKLKMERGAALEKHDYEQLKTIRQQIHDLKGKLRRSMV